MPKLVLDSISHVSKLVHERIKKPLPSPISGSFMKTPEKVSGLLEAMRAMSVMVSLQLDDISAPEERGMGLFRSLGVHHDELIHSNALAKCFKDASVKATTLLLGKLIGQDIIPAAPSKLSVWRERSLGSLPNAWRLGSAIRKRRLDLLIEHPDVALVIENKIESRESQHQTNDYYHALQTAYESRKKVVGILLSPDKSAPHCDQFRSLSYVDLYCLLEQVVREVPQERIGFLRLYSKELFDIFVQQRMKSYLQSKNYWKGTAA